MTKKNKPITVNGMLISEWRDEKPHDYHSFFRFVHSGGLGSITVFRHFNPPENVDFEAYWDLKFLLPHLKNLRPKTIQEGKEIVDEILERLSKLESFQ